MGLCDDSDSTRRIADIEASVPACEPFQDFLVGLSREEDVHADFFSEPLPPYCQVNSLSDSRWGGAVIRSTLNGSVYDADSDDPISLAFELMHGFPVRQSNGVDVTLCEPENFEAYLIPTDPDTNGFLECVVLHLRGEFHVTARSRSDTAKLRIIVASFIRDNPGLFAGSESSTDNIADQLGHRTYEAIACLTDQAVVVYSNTNGGLKPWKEILNCSNGHSFGTDNPLRVHNNNGDSPRTIHYSLVADFSHLHRALFSQAYSQHVYALQQFYEVEHYGQLPQRPPSSSESSLPLAPAASFRSRALREQGQRAVKQGEWRKEQEEITCKRQARDAEIAAEPPETDEPTTPWHENELSSSSKRKGKKKGKKKALSVFAEAVQTALKEASVSMITEVGVLQGVFKVPAGFGMDEETHIIDCPATIASSLTALHQTLSTELQVQKVTKARALRGDGDQFMCSEDRVFD